MRILFAETLKKLRIDKGLSQCLDTDVNTLLSAVVKSGDAPNIIIVDDRKIFLSGALPILEEVMPNAIIMGLIKKLRYPFLLGGADAND